MSKKTRIEAIRFHHIINRGIVRGDIASSRVSDSALKNLDNFL